MLHERHYTLSQAMAVRGWVAERVGWVRDARARLVALGAHATDAIAALDLESGGAYPGRDVAHSLVALSRAAGELEAVDIVLRWLVDDEDSIGFWHAPEAGFSGRRPL
jgi:hypothetical protein